MSTIIDVYGREILVYLAAHLVDVELAFVGGDLRLEHHLHEHVAQLLAQVARGGPLDGVDGLVGLLDHVLGDGGVGLLAVPGAAVGLAQLPYGAHEGVEVGVRTGRAGLVERRGRGFVLGHGELLPEWGAGCAAAGRRPGATACP